ncbi:MAG: flagellin lysine-N-methylase [Clostridium cochlearium]|uniref:flagellin lysine-N-methylase n=1 Tax=Clostridium cochlearium TaxID=1494 RepID=UPI00280ADD5F|nr:flagellin lysine-N-methylase [Clostridium cochlearium]MDU1444032.1 flagellin lysine-N-methylase [Clostridium cochlearium]
MSNSTKIILQPEYMKKFTCIGSSCKDSCCIGWRVSLDKDTYLKYKRNQDKELKPIFKNMVNRNRSGKNDASYGKIKMDEKGRCPFLNEDNLCKIHSKLGEKFLSNTCQIYPRFINKVDGMLERSATRSCPEVVRLALLNPNGIIFEQIEENEDTTNYVHKIFDTQGHLYLNKPERYFWQIRIFSLSLLQNRNYTLWQRLIILGMTYEKIEELSLNNLTKDIPIMLETMEGVIEDQSMKDGLRNIPNNNQIQMRLVKELMDKKLIQGVSSERYLKVVKETLLGIGYVEGADIREVLKTYEKNYNEYVLPYIKEKEYILENYLVNEYFMEIMPFGKYKSIWDSYMFLCVIYSMVKLHMIGVSGHYKELNDDLTLKIIQSFSKAILHNERYIQGIIKLLKNNGYDSLAYMAILVKNN